MMMKGRDDLEGVIHCCCCCKVAEAAECRTRTEDNRASRIAIEWRRWDHPDWLDCSAKCRESSSTTAADSWAGSVSTATRTTSCRNHPARQCLLLRCCCWASLCSRCSSQTFTRTEFADDDNCSGPAQSTWPSRWSDTLRAPTLSSPSCNSMAGTGCQIIKKCNATDLIVAVAHVRPRHPLSLFHQVWNYDFLFSSQGVVDYVWSRCIPRSAFFLPPSIALFDWSNGFRSSTTVFFSISFFFSPSVSCVFFFFFFVHTTRWGVVVHLRWRVSFCLPGFIFWSNVEVNYNWLEWHCDLKNPRHIVGMCRESRATN